MIGKFMTASHRHCDRLFADIEAAITGNNLTDAAAQLSEFTSEMERHFAMEEELLFPTFELVTVITNGPTAVMRDEHIRMRHMLQQMNEAMNRVDIDSYLGIAETLMVMMQQHNMKEEQILYRMIDNALIDQSEDIIGQLRKMSH